jgi:hypothetical protein
MANKKNGPQQPGTQPGQPATKMEAVQRALGEMGRDAKPLAIQAFVKDRFGVAISAATASQYKKVLAERARKRGRPKKAASPARERAAAAPAAGIPLDDILYVKGLVGRFGSEQLHTLIDAFAK